MAKVILENLKLDRDRLKVATAREAAITKILALEFKIASIVRGRGSRLTGKQTYELAVRTAGVALITAEREAEYKTIEIAQTIKLLELDIKRLEVATWRAGVIGGQTDKQIAANAQILAGAKAQLAVQQEQANIKVTSAKADVGEAILSGIGPSAAERFGHDFGTKVVEAVGKAMSIGSTVDTFLSNKIAILEAELSALETRKAAAPEGSPKAAAIIDEIKATQIAISQANAAIRQSYIATTAEGVMPFLEALRELGPEGEFVAAIGEGALIMAESMNVIATAGVEASSKLAAVGSIISAVMSMQSAASAANVAGIQSQIDIETKRDGQSAKSLAKIAAMEKKKDRMKKKQFEIDKKMSMANIVISTAAGIMKAIEQGGIYGMIFGAVIAVLGAAQLAIVAGTSYQGAATAPSASGPSAVSIGSKNNSVDLAQSTSPSGELAYARGDRGVGNQGATNFIPSFTGRATGGNTGLIVGEQGPELFIPERPGTVLPADETATLQPAGANVTLNVHAIDAQGVEEALMGQQNNIIRIIREAANDQGEGFLENINTI
jgi:hypothetical protein